MKKRDPDGNGENTETTVADILREISAKLDKLDSIDGRLDSIDRRIDAALRRDQSFDARISKLETRLAKLERKRS
jgi:chromosome segregation ATPase